MSLELWIAFILASSAMLVIPGPTVIMVSSYALGRGRSSAFATIPGVLLGDLVAMTTSMLGAGAILATSATLFTAMKWIGAAYLIWMGIKMWRESGSAAALNAKVGKESNRTLFRNAFIVTALNPKGIVFFVAFVPQFVDPARPALMQFVLLQATFLGCVFVIVTGWAMLAGSLRGLIKSPAYMRATQRVGGTFLIGAGLLTASLKRAN